ncbi:YjdJ family protein [Niallia sp. XMNu-256]|uniref:YjdJ family protein n=1 Tax=Niallia sp. XMNu-256 TaxID=3082444 RepID=UPI0030CD2C90
MFKIMIQLGLSFMVFLVSTIVAWYEGSNLLQDTHEWKSTAIFSQWLNGEVIHSGDILLVDFFIYAAKFFPTFPILMLLSGTHLLVLIGYLLFRRSQKGYAGYLSFFGILFLGISGIVANSPSHDLHTFFNIFFIIGIFLTVAALVRIFRSNRAKEPINI